MAKAPSKVREEARRLFLTGEMTNNVEIAVHLKVKPHTIGQWRRQEDWDGLRLKIDRRAAEMLVDRLASERVHLNTNHYKLWSVVVSQLLESLKTPGSEEKVKNLDRVSAILDRAQKGQRLARGLALDGQTEEQIRADAEAEGRQLIDLFIEVVKAEVPDPDIRDRIAWAILRSIHACKNGLNVIYYFPTKTDVLDFSKSRVAPLLADNPFLGRLITDTDTAGLKRIGSAHLYLRGMQSTVGLKSVPADMLVFDELDEATPEARSLAKERLAHS